MSLTTKPFKSGMPLHCPTSTIRKKGKKLFPLFIHGEKVPLKNSYKMTTLTQLNKVTSKKINMNNKGVKKTLYHIFDCICVPSFHFLILFIQVWNIYFKHLSKETPLIFPPLSVLITFFSKSVRLFCKSMAASLFKGSSGLGSRKRYWSP